MTGGENAPNTEELERFRAALEDAVDRSTLRAVAVAVGMSPTGLRKFLDGTKPYGPTVERLRIWYYHKAGVQLTPPAEIASLLRRLVVTLPQPDGGVARVLAAVDASYREAGMYPPAWVAAVRELVG